ncbi:unnamed protein product, partial [Symbiodinium microadriaticum]
DIPPGSFVAGYLGEVLDEADCERRGLRFGDEYLFALDAWGRSRACERLEVLGLKREQQRRHSTIQFPASTIQNITSVVSTDLRYEEEDQPPPAQMECEGEQSSVVNTVDDKYNSLNKADGVQGSSAPKGRVKSAVFTSLDKVKRLKPAHFVPSPHCPNLCETASMTRAEIADVLGKDLTDKICKSRAIILAGKHLILRGGYREPVSSTSPEQEKLTAVTPKSSIPSKKKIKNTQSSRKGNSIPWSEDTTIAPPLNGDSKQFPLEAYLPCSAQFRQRWMSAWNDARSVITDRVLMETESRDNSFTIDAK